MERKIILASQSPRRKELLEKHGLSFCVFVTDADETVTQPMPPDKLVKELSLRKAKSAAECFLNDAVLVIAADTVVVSDGVIFGKPVSEEHAFSMLQKLSGNTHSVFTGTTVAEVQNCSVRYRSFVCETKVSFYELSEEEIRSYIATKEPFDKAGSYAIQGIASKFVKEIDGDFDNVVGLPAKELLRVLRDEFGLR